MTDTAQPMVLPFFINDAPSVSPDKGLQLLPIPWQCVAIEARQIKARFGGFVFYEKRLGVRAFEVPRALYLGGNVEP